MYYDKKKISERIKQGRKSIINLDTGRSYSQKELGDLLFLGEIADADYDYGRKQVSSWENGRGIPSLDILLKMCELFNCELGYLLGEYDTKTRATVDIIEETGLTEKAVEQLQRYKAAAENMPNITFKTDISTELMINKTILRTMIHKELFIPALISFMLEHPELEKISDRMCAQSLVSIDYLTKSGIEKAIMKEAYKKAVDSVPIHRKDDVSLLNKRYKEIIKQILIDRKEDITQALPIKFTDGLYEWAFIPNMQDTFNLARNVSAETIDMHSFLNSRDIFDIIKEFISVIPEIR